MQFHSDTVFVVFFSKFHEFHFGVRFYSDSLELNSSYIYSVLELRYV